MLAYTNRFLALASLIRNLHGDYKISRDPHILTEIQDLRRRVWLIRVMQTLAVLTLMMCVVCMLLLIAGIQRAAHFTFATALVTLMFSFAFSLTEIQLSVGALNLHLRDIEEESRQK